MAKFTDALNSKLNNLAGDAISGIDNKYAREGVQNLVDRFLPGFGGGTPDFRDKNAYAELVTRYTEAQAQLDAFTGISDNSDDEKLSTNYDWRARLRPKEGGADQFYSAIPNGDYLMRPIRESNGLIWQYTPSVFITGGAEYSQHISQGSNYSINTYINSRMPMIPVSAEFTANDQYEARYILAIMTFMKVATKSYYGDTAVAQGNYGTPPPVLVFEYLGEHGFNKVPVVVTNYSIQFPDDVDYVPVRTNIKGGDSDVTYIPAKMRIDIDLMPTYTPHKLRKRFDITTIADGTAYKDGFI